MKRVQIFKKIFVKTNRGITLISLIITVIILLILAITTLSLTLGKKGIFNIAKQAGENYINASNKELADLEELYSSLQIAINDSNSQITISKEDLDNYINAKIQDSIKTITYDLSEILTLNEGCSLINGSVIKKTGNVVCIDLKVEFTTNVPSDTWTIIGNLKDEKLIPSYQAHGESSAGNMIGNCWIETNGKIQLRNAKSNNVFFVSIIYIVE